MKRFGSDKVRYHPLGSCRDLSSKVVSGSELNGALVEELTDAILVGSAATYTVTKTNISVVTAM
jgi:hypothetical protein